MKIIIDGFEIRPEITPFKEGRRVFLHLESILSALGWTYQIEEDRSLTISTLNRKRTTWMHDEWDDTLRILDGEIFIHSKRLSEVTKTEIVHSDKSSTITISTSQLTNGTVDLPIHGRHIIIEDEPDEISTEESQKINYGKYTVPQILKDLEEFSLQMEKEGSSLLNELGFYISNEHSPYGNTPFDVIVFGWTGGDGEHFGFLTEFGSVENLDDAPIVQVYPMGGDEAVEVIANNIREFLRIYAIDHTLIYHAFDSEEAYQAYILKEEAELLASNPEWLPPTEEDRARKREVIARLIAAIELPEIEMPYNYLNRIRIERERKIVAATKEGLGIININSAEEGRKHETLFVDEDLEIEELGKYIENATNAGKLALIRDLNATAYIDDEIGEVMIEEMRKLGLHDEIARMNATSC